MTYDKTMDSNFKFNIEDYLRDEESFIEEETAYGRLPLYEGPLPNEAQLRYLDEKYAAFLHFGMNTYTEIEWGDGKETLDQFTMTDFDYEGYVKTIKDLGFKRLIFTAKHHDGFCMWDTKETDHNIMNTAYGKDFLALLSEACTKYDLEMGLYLSPWDVHEPSYGSGNAYNEFYLAQIKEIVDNPIYGNNGHFVEWWFDNAKGEDYPDQVYNFDDFMAAIRDKNPDIVFFGVGAAGGIHWAGNELGYAPSENAPRLPKGTFEIDYYEAFRSAVGHDQSHVFSIAECDTSVTDRWFSHPDDRVKTVDELFEIYLKSIGRGGVLLLNIPANKAGTIDDEIVDRIKEVKEKIHEEFKNPIEDGLLFDFTDIGNDQSLRVTNKDGIDINYVVLSEDISQGSRFTHGYIFVNEERLNIDSLGAKRIIDLRAYDKINELMICLYGDSHLHISEISIY